MIQPKYRCHNAVCGGMFTTQRPDGVECKLCGSRYVEWVNFSEWRAAWHRNDPPKTPF
jgi:DNA-directed RNA polymerase subunit RPC12/RpoP